MSIRLASVLLVTVAVLWLAVPRLVGGAEPAVMVGHERYDPALSSINSIDAAERALPRYIRHTGHPQKDIADGIQLMLSERFVHGFSQTTIREDWIAYVVGAGMQVLFDTHGGASHRPVIDSPVVPDEILQHAAAKCSQQMIVFDSLLARHGIDYARVSYLEVPSHDALAAKVDGVWRYYDTDKEPTVTGLPLADVLKGDVLPAMYPMVEDGVNMGLHFRDAARGRKIVVRDIDTYPASRGASVQRMTALLSRWGWILPLVAGLYLLFLSRFGSHSGVD